MGENIPPVEKPVKYDENLYETIWSKELKPTMRTSEVTRRVDHSDLTDKFSHLKVSVIGNPQNDSEFDILEKQYKKKHIKEKIRRNPQMNSKHIYMNLKFPIPTYSL